MEAAVVILRHRLSAFLFDLGMAPAHAGFLGTGGSLEGM